MPTDDNKQALAVRVREARISAGLSQGQLAKLMGLHRPAISEIEAGKRNVRTDELVKIADLLDVSVDFLTGATSDVATLQDAKAQLAARELSKLSPEALDRVLKILASVREKDKDPKENE